jgi:hypothetical protein
VVLGFFYIWSMAFKVKLYSIADDLSEPEYQSPLSATKDDTFATFRAFLEDEGLLDFPFDFWICEDKKRMLPRFERFNAVGEEIIVICKVGVHPDVSKRRKISVDHGVDQNSEFGAEDVEEIPGSNDGDGDAELLQPGSSSRVGDEEETPPKTHLESQIVPKEIIQKYLQTEEKLRRELATVSLDDNIWYLKSWDANGLGMVKIHCGECVKDFGGNTGEHNNHTISNFFANFRKHHLNTTAHIRSLCRRQGLPYTDHPMSTAPKGKSIILSNGEHERLVREGTNIMEEVNDTADGVDGKKPFYVVGDPTSDGFKYRSYWFKIRCQFCGDFFQLYPPKKNLHANLTNHLQGLKHARVISDSISSSKSASSALYTGRRGRPAKSNGSI